VLQDAVSLIANQSGNRLLWTREILAYGNERYKTAENGKGIQCNAVRVRTDGPLQAKKVLNFSNYKSSIQNFKYENPNARYYFRLLGVYHRIILK
jgi:hypothetical protein